MARNPYQPGVGATPPYLAGREQQLRRFQRILDGYPEKRRNVRVTGLRGVGKTVLLKEFERLAKTNRPRRWVVIRRDFVPRMAQEVEFVTAIAEYLREAAEQLSVRSRLRNRLADTMKAIGEIQVGLADGLTVKVGAAGRPTGNRIVEDRLRTAFAEVGRLAAATRRGVLFMFDEAHEVFDQPRRGEYPLSALLSAIVAAQDQDDPPLPLMLVLCGLPSLAGNLRAARSHAERLFRADELANLSLAADDGTSSEAELALTRPIEGGPIRFTRRTVKQVVRDVDGYPYFIQWFGEALWDAAADADSPVVDERMYAASRRLIRRSLDREFYEGRYDEAPAADQLTLRAAASLGGETFTVAELNAALPSRKPNANAQSLKRLTDASIVYRIKQGKYGYTAPLFGDFLRREHAYGADER
ncbi:MAG TPA: ATP-binding protein [Conexibacter sp.]|nr:ATP-binding protein [Conexibacter sp.]